VPDLDVPVVRLVTAHNTSDAEVEQFLRCAGSWSKRLAA
jgi:hypothetical protein